VQVTAQPHSRNVITDPRGSVMSDLASPFAIGTDEETGLGL
jgi:hypothetical protein